MFDLTKCYCSTGLIFNFFSNWPNVRQQINNFFLTVTMSTHAVTNDTNDRELIESPFGTAGQFRSGIRSVIDLNHVVKSDYKYGIRSEQQERRDRARLHLILPNVHVAVCVPVRATIPGF
jgi:hypothetical protein